MALDEARRIGAINLGHDRNGDPLPMRLHLSPAAYDEAEAYLNNGPWSPSADAVALDMGHRRPELRWAGAPIVRDEHAPYIDVRQEGP